MQPPSTDDANRCAVRCVNEASVAAARSRLSGSPYLPGMMALFAALGDATRLRMLVALLDERLCTCDLAAVLGITESAVSHQLRGLRALKLIGSDREGKMVFHRIADDHVRALVELAAEHVQEGIPA